MHCPVCHADDTKVVDSRLAEEGAAVRRRRHCLSCAHRFTTFERVDEVPLVVLKSDGRSEPFDRAKIVAGILAATKGRHVGPAVAEQIAEAVEDGVRLQGSEVTSAQLGLAVLDRLRTVDEVAYLRFASVYKNFDAAADFHREIELLTKASEPSEPWIGSADAAHPPAVEVAVVRRQVGEVEALERRPRRRSSRGGRRRRRGRVRR